MALNKGEEVRFLSHLDYAGAVSRILRRAKLDVAYSEGFNPHMKVSFSSALALGITASTEYMDVDVLEDTPVEEIMERMNAQAPKGMEVKACREVPLDVKKMMAACNYAEYIVEGSAPEGVDWEALLAPFNEAETIIYEKVTPKKTKEIDLKHFVKEPLRAEAKDGRVKIYMGIGIYPEGTVKPSEIWKFGKEQYQWPVGDDYAIHREAIMIEKDGHKLSPMDV